MRTNVVPDQQPDCKRAIVPAAEPNFETDVPLRKSLYESVCIPIGTFKPLVSRILRISCRQCEPLNSQGTARRQGHCRLTRHDRNCLSISESPSTCCPPIAGGLNSGILTRRSYMPLSIACPVCKSVLQIPDNLQGQAVLCGHCSKPIQVPAAQPRPIPMPIREHSNSSASISNIGANIGHGGPPQFPNVSTSRTLRGGTPRNRSLPRPSNLIPVLSWIGVFTAVTAIIVTVFIIGNSRRKQRQLEVAAKAAHLPAGKDFSVTAQSVRDTKYTAARAQPSIRGSIATNFQAAAKTSACSACGSAATYRSQRTERRRTARQAAFSPKTPFSHCNCT